MILQRKDAYSSVQNCLTEKYLFRLRNLNLLFYPCDQLFPIGPKCVKIAYIVRIDFASEGGYSIIRWIPGPVQALSPGMLSPFTALRVNSTKNLSSAMCGFFAALRMTMNRC